MGSFLKAHPQTAAECSIHQLQGKLGLKFDEYALVVPYLKKGGIVLKLIKSGEDWMNVADPDELYGKRASRTGLTQTTKVTFGGVAATNFTKSATQVTATVPTGAVTGKIGITTAGGTATSATVFHSVLSRSE
jgi:hypothetical protein